MEIAKVSKEAVILAVLAEVFEGRSVAAALKTSSGEEIPYRIEAGDPIVHLRALLQAEFTTAQDAMESLRRSEGYDEGKAVYTFGIDGKLIQVNL